MLNSPRVKSIAKAHTPEAVVNIRQGFKRHDVVSELSGDDNLGIELGVAEGVFSKRMLESGKFKHFYGVDLYGDTHDTKEYLSTLKYIGLENDRYTLLRTDFTSALELFPDEHFDFIYVDGFAHTGEEGGQTLIDWLAKLKPGGILAGDDYHSDWPLVVWAVNHLATSMGCSLEATSETEQGEYCKYPTWWLTKPGGLEKIETDPLLLKIGLEEKRRIHNDRTRHPNKLVRIAGDLLQALGLKESVKQLLGR